MTTTREAELSELRAGSAQVGVELDGNQFGRLQAFVDLLYVWNRSSGLTNVARADSVRLHVLDSLVVVPFVGGGPCLDLGTGAGLPGLVLAIARPDVEFTLVESNRRRCSFLLEAVRSLPVPNVRVLEEDVARVPVPPLYPVVLSRAFRPPAEFLDVAARFLSPGGRVVLMLADPADDEIESLSRGAGLNVVEVRRARLPGGEEPRTVLALRRP